MIISPDQIFWFIYNRKKLDEKIFLKIAKSRGIEVSDSLRKSINNTFKSRNRPSGTTIKSIINLLTKIIPGHNLPTDEQTFLTDVQFSNPQELLDHIESEYNLFFEKSYLESSFLAVEIKQIFVALRKMLEAYDGSEVSFLSNIQTDSTFTEIFDLDHDLFIDMNASDVFGFKTLSLNITIYILFCLELSYYEPEQIVRERQVNRIFNQLIADRIGGNKKQPFWYYTDVLREEHDWSFEYISEKLDIELSTFNYYRTGGRKIVNIQHISSIWENDGFFYFVAVFLKYFVDILPDLGDIELLKKTYEKYSRLSIERYEEQFLPNMQEPHIRKI